MSINLERELAMVWKLYYYVLLLTDCLNFIFICFLFSRNVVCVT